MKTFDINQIDMNYDATNQILGHIKEEKGHIFKVWSPLAKKMNVNIYAKDESIDYTVYEMSPVKDGVWEVTITDVLWNKYYTFTVTHETGTYETVDPYATALSVNGQKGAIIDLSKGNPDDWDDYKRAPLASNVDAVIYELHVRDLSIDQSSGIINKGKFLGLTEQNTTTPCGAKTGLSHIKDLGVTHVQLLPIYDFGSVDETLYHLDGEYENSLPYNWGYDPMHYNTPEGSYATNPYDPISRVRELKLAVKTLHDQGLKVIMDVVYNHMYDVATSSFNQLVPGYFFRYDEAGKLRDESFCGNAIASEHKMVRKFIVESIKHWAKEYKLDGFRFDLMGLIDVKTMQQIKVELEKIDPSIIVLGEGWDMGETLHKADKAIQANAYKLPQIAFFSDNIRDALRGSMFVGNPEGFLTGGNGLEDAVKRGVVGGVQYSEKLQTWGVVEPHQVVNYIECHDNHTLYDKLSLTITDEETLKDYSRLGASIMILAQGIPFIHAGQEFMRTKQGVENSYNSDDTINKLDWIQKAQNEDTVSYFKGLIVLRKHEAAFRLRTAKAIKEKLKFVDAPKNVVAYTLDEKLIVIHNANQQAVKVEVPNASWDIVVNKEVAGIDVIESVKGNTLEVVPCATIVAYKK